MKTIPPTTEVLVLRTDFSDDVSWKALCREIETPDSEFGFLANIEFCDDPAFGQITLEHVLAALPGDYVHPIIFVADATTFASPEHAIVCMDLVEQPGNFFRVIPSEMWGVENNLSISNMYFSEFAESVNDDGVFRGFE